MATTMARVGSGSKVQPSRSEAIVGASAGTGPWASTGPAARLVAAIAMANAPAERRIEAERSIGGIVARTATHDARAG